MTATLETLLTRDHIQLRNKSATWQEAITAVAEPLVQSGAITRGYVESMIQTVHEYGPYVVLVPHVALAHAKPEDSVLQTAMSALTLATPVEFGHSSNDPVSVVFCLAAKDSNSHMSALRQFVKVIGTPNRIEQLASAESVDAFLELMKTNRPD